MKNFVWCGALALACWGSAAMAEVDVYGRVNLSVDRFDTGDDTESVLANNQSRIGLRAGDRLSGGIQAYAQLELGVDLTGSDERFVLRDSFGALATNLGMIRVGYFDTPMRAVGGMADLFGNQLGSARNLTRSHLDADGERRQGFDERVRNSVHYRSPPLGDWIIDLQYALDGDDDHGDDESFEWDSGFASPGTEDAGDFRSMALSYHSGGVRLGWANEKHTERRANRYFFQYDSNAMQWTALYQSADEPDETVWGVGIGYQPERTNYRVQYYQLEGEEESLDAELWAVGIDMQMTQAFHIHLNYAWVENASAQRLAPYQEGRAGGLREVTPGETTSGWSLGVSYRF